MREQWEKDLQSRLGDYRKKAPEGLLGDIKKEMAQRGICPSSAEAHCLVLPMWLKAVAAVVVIVASVAVGTFLWNENGGRPAQLARTTSKSNDVPVGESSVDGVESGVIDATHALPHDNALLNIVSGKLASLTAGVSERLVDVGQNIAESVNNNLYKKEMALAQTDESRMKTDGVNAPESTVAMAASPTTDSSQPQKPPVSGNHPKRWYDESHSVQSVASSGFHNKSRIELGAFYSGVVSSDGRSSGTLNPDYKSNYREISGYLRYKSVGETLEETHKFSQPIKLGLSFRYIINEKWSIQTGLTYSRLSSTSQSFSDFYEYDCEQILHYVGLPVSLNYSIWRNRHVNVYAVAGGEVEKLVKGKTTTYPFSLTINKRGSTIPISEKVKESRPQFSLKAAAGIEYDFTKQVGVYAEPGLGYYIDNGSGVMNFYKDKPLNFSINVGMRINFGK